MNLATLTELWQSQQIELQKSLEINKELAKEVNTIKIHHLLTSMRPIKLFALILGVLWIIFVDGLLVATYHISSSYFFWCALMQSFITKIAIGIYIYQLVLIHQTDFSGSVGKVQQQLAKLTLSTLWVSRVLFLQLPLWVVFWWTDAFLEQLTPLSQSFLLATTMVFTAGAIWLFINIRMENSDKTWFRWIFSGKEWEPLAKAKEMLDDIV